jgi:hypothetical protein
MPLFNDKPHSHEVRRPKRARRVYLSEDTGNTPPPKPKQPQAIDGRIRYSLGREQPEKGPVHFVCPWAMTGVDEQGVAHLHHFKLLAAATPVSEVIDTSRDLSRKWGWHRLRVINLNASDLRR